MKEFTGPLALVVLDGWGLAEATDANGIAIAETPVMDSLQVKYPFSKLEASGEAVGLPAGQIGNSEVGHTTIGAGCVLYQDLVRIGKDVELQSFHSNPAFLQAFEHVKKNNSQLHVLGLLSTGGVHSHEKHFFAVLEAARQHGVNTILAHPFLDGRDTSKTEGASSLEKLEKLVENLGGCDIGSVSGRYYAMDRDTNWDRTDKAFKAIFEGKADSVYDTSISPAQIIREKYHTELYDEHMEPMVFKTKNGEVMEVKDNDAIIFTNFRTDRTRQLSKLICEKATEKNLLFVTMTEYGGEVQAAVAYKAEKVQMPLAQVISEADLKQVHIAETEKYPHVTYFVNGGKQEPFAGEEDVLVPSRKDIKTHDQAPEMKAKEICDEAIARLETADFLFINFANPDMVGHTANQKAIKIAVETVDKQLGRLVDAVLQQDGALLIIADHGNAEQMVDPKTGEPHTAHTTNLVPCIFVCNTNAGTLKSGGLKDVAPTVIKLLGLKQPKTMTGASLV
ncbi:MAG: 2,3-bisphosphoglycerate-independent phosphoglycerate mutase [Patescibacteria group bacterium]|jgi:2,3-bisphosphoglycerate-independent phosphoglycerate mutase|nr:2,3-bisphosphoglycerate-independent phosphoglycerate mutase [Patescibacteria group bacterium]